MADIGCRAKFRWKRWKRSGYREVLNSGGVQSLAMSKAREVQRAQGEGYEVITIKGKLANGYLVRPVELGGERPRWPNAKKKR